MGEGGKLTQPRHWAVALPVGPPSASSATAMEGRFGRAPLGERSVTHVRLLQFQN
jgi:hypothetical protein